MDAVSARLTRRRPRNSGDVYRSRAGAAPGSLVLTQPTKTRSVPRPGLVVMVCVDGRELGKGNVAVSGGKDSGARRLLGLARQAVDASLYSAKRSPAGAAGTAAGVGSDPLKRRPDRAVSAVGVHPSHLAKESFAGKGPTA